MWLTLLLAVAVCVAVLYVPGYLLARSFSIERFASIAMAPLFSVFVIVVLGIVLEKLSITCSGIALLAAAIAICLLALVICKGLSHRATSSNKRELIAVDDAGQAYKTAALYIIVSLAITTVVFLLAIDGPESFSRNDDTTVHLAVVRTFLDTGTFSTLHTGSYLDQGIVGSFYPAAWHVITAIVASFFGNAVTLATNATLITFLVFVFPLAMCLFFLKTFGGNRCVLFAGALCVLAFCGFPWEFIVFGQLLPNMISFMFIPLTLVALMTAIESKEAFDRVKLSFITIIGLIVIALSQPNGAFVFGIWAVLYSLSRIFFQPDSDKLQITSKRIIVAILIFASACTLWAAMYFAPFMQTAVQYTWKATLSPLVAFGSGLAFMFTSREGVQPFLSIIVLVGVIYTCRNRRYMWLTIAYAFAFLLYIISVSTDGVLKHVLTGFWYTDYHRLGAMTAFFAIPLAALGFAQVIKLAQTWYRKISKHARGSENAYISPLIIILALFVICQFFPGHVKITEKIDVYAGLMKIRNEVTTRYSWERVLTSEENAFIEQAMEVIPPGALVINVPSDGSCWSYGVEGIDTYFRRSANNGRGGAEESKLIRTQLCNIETSSEVRQLMNELDARYVLLLDDPTGDNRTTTSMRYKAEDWVGIESINEETPGFTLLLSEGDMRLYEITE